ncbi:glycoside hydrolase family 32 protein [soil metagenome]
MATSATSSPSPANPDAGNVVSMGAGLGLLLVTLATGGIQTMDERAELLAKAEKAVQAALPAAEKDPNRPQIHFRAPAQWMNDPNGTIFHDGWFHVFYQFNPYGDGWGNMHWGHARSRDMLDWEMLPIALWPSKSQGEDHVFSGSTFIDGEGKPTIFYTSIGDKRPPEQWMARPTDKDWIAWQKPTANPILTVKAHEPQGIDEWRDPFLVRKEGVTFMLVGGRVEGKGVVALYRAKDKALADWQYVGILFRHPEEDLIECPNLAQVNGKWLLLVSVAGRVESFVGTFEPKPEGFGPEHRATLHPGSYASQLLTDGEGRTIHLAWVRTDGTQGWNGCLTLPTLLSVDKGGTVRSQPIPALQKLREGEFHLANADLRDEIEVPSERSTINDPRSTAPARLEIETEIDPGTAKTIRLRLCTHGDAKDAYDIAYDPNSKLLTIPKAPPITLSGETLKLHIFLDGGMMSVYADEGAIATSEWLPNAQEHGVRLIAEEGRAKILSFKAYTLRPAKFAPQTPPH